MQMPETHYARAGDLRIAYQQWGEGPPLMFIPALISNIEISWEHELYRRNFEHFGRHMTCVQFDKRGIGLSDRFDGVPTMEQRNEDIVTSQGVARVCGWVMPSRGSGSKSEPGFMAGRSRCTMMVTSRASQ